MGLPEAQKLEAEIPLTRNTVWYNTRLTHGEIKWNDENTFYRGEN